MTTNHLRKFLPVIAIILLALMVPIALLVVAFTPSKKEKGTSESVADGLRASLEAVADQQLPSPAPANSMPEIPLLVPMPDRVMPLLATLARELGGSALPRESSDGLLRSVFSLPEEKCSEFFRRVELLTGSQIAPPSESALFVIALRGISPL